MPSKSLAALIAAIAVLAAAFAFSSPALAQQPASIDLAIEVEAASRTGAFNFTASNLGTKDAFGVAVRIELPEQEIIRISPDMVGYDPSTGVWYIGRLDAGSSESGVISTKLAPELASTYTRLAVPARAVISNSVPAEPAALLYNNSAEAWTQATPNGSNQQRAGSPFHTMLASVDDPSPQNGDTVRLGLTMDYQTAAEDFDATAYGIRIRIQLPPGLGRPTVVSEVSPGAFAAIPPGQERTWEWSIGSYGRSRDLEIDLDMEVTSSADLAGQCITAELTIERPYDDPSDNSAKACFEQPTILFQTGDTDLLTAYPCVGPTATAYPCSAADTVEVITFGGSAATNAGIRLASRPDKLEAILQPENIVIQVKDDQGGRVAGSSGVTWQTRAKDQERRGARRGVAFAYSRIPFNNDIADWSKAALQVGVRVLDGNAQPGDMSILSSSSGRLSFHPVTRPQIGPFNLTSPVSASSQFFAKFEKLGTYALDFTVEATHGTKTGDCDTDNDNTNDAFCHTGSPIFHVGPIAELEARAGDSGLGVGPGQTALTVLAVNNGPDNALGAKADVVLALPDGVTVQEVAASGETSYDPAAGVWDLGALWHKDQRRAAGLREGETLTFILVGADAASASLTATIYHDNENHPYTVCIGSDARDVDAASEAACPASASWHEGTVYDYRDYNNTATVGARADIAPPAEPGLVKVEGGPLALHEGGEDGEYTIVLGSRPSHDVRIRVSSDNRDVAVDTDNTTEGNQNTLTFTPLNWPNRQTVKVSAAHDADAVNDTATLTHTASSSDGGFNGIRIATVSVDVDDDEPPEIHLTPLPLPTLNEGDTATYTVALTAPPSVGSVPLELFVFGDEDIEVRPAAFTLNRSNWERGQMVTVTARPDGDGQDDTASIVHVPAANAAAEYRGKIAEQVVTVLDDDVPGVRLSALSRQVIPEGQTATYTARLNVAPAANVTITLASDNLGVTVDTDPATGAYENTLTFTPDNATVEQTVTVIALNDDNAADETATITGTLAYTHPDPATGEDYTGIIVPGVSVTVDDDETAGITLSESALAIVEGLDVSVTDTYTVALAEEPTGSVTIDLSSDNGDVMVTPAPLTFTGGTSGNWNVPQTVTVAVADDADSLPDTATITHAVNDGSSADEYDGLSAVLKVTVEDSDVPGLTFNPARLTVEESGSADYDVVLNVEPSLDVTVRISSNNSDVTVEPSELTFTGGASGNWNAPQTVTVSAAVDSDETDDTLRLTHRMDRSEAPEYRSKTVELEGTVTETMVDYANENGLIEIRTQQQLNAVRWDLDGNGKPDAGPAGNEDKEYRRAFPQYGNCQDNNGVPQDCMGYVLMNDITLSGNWTPIGGNLRFDDYDTLLEEYSGEFDGNGYTIRNLRINGRDRKEVGLFGAIGGSETVIRNVGLPNVNVEGRDNVGALVGRNNGGRIEDAWSTGQVSGNTFTGGLVGWNRGGTVAQSYSEANVSGWNPSDSGGPLWSTRIAGLVGSNHDTIENSYARGRVRGRGHVAGLAGENDGTIRNSYSTGAVSTEEDWPHKGGLVGWQLGSVENSYWETEIDGKHKGVSKGVAQGSENGITGQTDKQLQEPASNIGIYAGWDATIWNFGEANEYPCLSGVGSCPE